MKRCAPGEFHSRLEARIHESMKMRVQELAEIVSGRVVGDGATQIERIADLEHAREAEIAYVENEKLFAAAAESKASCLIVHEDWVRSFRIER